MKLFGLICRLAGTVLAAAPAWYLLQLASVNLPVVTRTVLLAGGVSLALIFGFAAGSVVARRMLGMRDHLITFTGLTASVTGGIVGAACLAGITAAYLTAYLVWPPDMLGRALVVLAVPAFGLVGWFVGAAIGLVVGVLAGGFLRTLAVFWR